MDEIAVENISETKRELKKFNQWHFEIKALFATVFILIANAEDETC